MRTIVTLVPERKLGIVVLANLNLTVFPEAVRAQFIEKFIGPSGEDLQEKVRESQAKWDALLELPKPPEKPSPLSQGLDAYTGVYESKLYDRFTAISGGDKLRIEAGPNRYAGNLKHWTDNTFLLTWPDMDDEHGLITFTIGTDGKIKGFDSEDYGPFKGI